LGVDHPRAPPRDWRRFAGQEVRVRGRDVLAERARTLEGTIVGLVEEKDGDLAELRLADGAVVRVPLADVRDANLVFRWGARDRSG
jgi:ribosome maturation factor RimP